MQSQTRSTIVLTSTLTLFALSWPQVSSWKNPDPVGRPTTLAASTNSLSQVNIAAVHRCRNPIQILSTTAGTSVATNGDRFLTAKRFPLQAIVQLKDLQLPLPQVRGEATLPLKFLEQSRSFTIDLRVAGQREQFLLDTGASTSLISPQLVQRLKLSGKPIPSDQLSLAVAGDDCPEITAQRYSLPSLVAGNLKIQGLQGLVFSRTILPEGLAGVLGMDVLGQTDLRLNPQTLQLQWSSAPLGRAKDTKVIPLRSKLGVMLAEVNINELGPFTFLLDTGADSVFISPGLAARLSIAPASRQPLQVLGFCGLEMAERVTLQNVQLDQYRQANLEGIILNSPILKQLGVEGILGQNFFNHYQQHWQFQTLENQKSGNNKTTSRSTAGSLLLTPLVK